MALIHRPKVVTDGLVCCLDAANPRSYPGSGTVWYDVSGNRNDFNILSTAYNSTGPKYMDFRGSYGIAKTASQSDISLSDASGVTFFVVTRVLETTTNWRTLTRSHVADHHVIIENGGWNIGMFDNIGAATFISSGYSQQSLPNYGTSNWIAMYWRWQSASPYYQLSYNDTPSTIRGSITDANSRFVNGVGSVGGYHENEKTNPATASQYWGDIAFFSMYAMYLTDAQILHNFNVLRGRFGL